MNSSVVFCDHSALLLHSLASVSLLRKCGVHPGAEVYSSVTEWNWVRVKSVTVPHILRGQVGCDQLPPGRGPHTFFFHSSHCFSAKKKKEKRWDYFCCCFSEKKNIEQNQIYKSLEFGVKELWKQDQCSDRATRWHMSYMCLLFGQHGFPLKNDVKAFDELSDMGHVAVKWKQMISVPIFLNILINVIINNKIKEVKNIF